MILSDEQMDAISPYNRNGLIESNWRWPDKVIPYQLSNEHSKRENDMIEEALKRIESVSCVKFKRRTNEKDYIQLIVSVSL